MSTEDDSPDIIDDDDRTSEFSQNGEVTLLDCCHRFNLLQVSWDL